MKRMIVFTGALLLLGSTVFSQRTLTLNERMAWWREARFGMFIHWGVYAVPAGTYNDHQVKGIGEWIMNSAKIPVDDYKQYAKQFNPVKYDAETWVKMARNAGMKYIIITAKHHDGFALFDSKASKWNIVDATPYGKDVIKPLAEACRKYGIKLGLYYSQNQDWVNPGGAAYLKAANQGYDNMPNAAKIDQYTKANNGHWDPVQTSKPFSQYIDEVAVPQVKEILTNYGDIAVLWWDTPRGMDEESAKKLDAVLALQPGIITNNRLMDGKYPGDTKTPEQRIPDLKELDGKDWETCMTMNGTWGFKSFDKNWKSTQTLLRNLIDIASKGGNYLLNVGPTAEGEIPQESITRLNEVGNWMKTNGEAIYGTKTSPLTPLTWGRCTMKEDKNSTILYLSVFEWPKDGKLIVPGITNTVRSAKLLENSKRLPAKRDKDGITISLPANGTNAIASVIKLQLNGRVEAMPGVSN